MKTSNKSVIRITPEIYRRLETVVKCGHLDEAFVKPMDVVSHLLDFYEQHHQIQFDCPISSTSVETVVAPSTKASKKHSTAAEKEQDLAVEEQVVLSPHVVPDQLQIVFPDPGLPDFVQDSSNPLPLLEVVITLKGGATNSTCVELRRSRLRKGLKAFIEGQFANDWKEREIVEICVFVVDSVRCEELNN